MTFTRRLAPTVNWINSVLVCIAQVALAYITYLYLGEAKALREQGAEQLELLRQQSQLTQLPTLTGTVTDIEDRAAAKNLAADSTIEEDMRDRLLKELKEDPALYTCSVQNVSPKVAEGVRVMIYDASTRSFLFCEIFQEVIASNSQIEFELRAPRLSAEEVIEKLREYYGSGAPDASVLAKELTLDQTSYLGVMFKDISGTIYLRKRQFSVQKDGGIMHHTSSLVWFW